MITKKADAADGLRDFMARVREYEKVYEPITDEEVSSAAKANENFKFRYLQTFNAGQKIVTVGCEGFIMAQVLPLLHNIHLQPRKVSIVLAGESINDQRGFRGGDSLLSNAGLQYSKVVSDLIKKRAVSGQAVRIWTGTLRRYAQQVDMLSDGSCLVFKLKFLDELCFGSLEGLACGYMKQSFPDEHAKRKADKFSYRYPGAGGESYMDLMMRLQPCVQQLERTTNDVIVVCDVAVARVLLGYYQGTPIQDIPNIKVSPGIIELTRSHSGFHVSTLSVNDGDVSLLAKES